MRFPDVRLWVKNTGQTPAKWYEFRCVCAVDEQGTSGIDFEELNKRKAIRWNALDSGADLSISHHEEQDRAAIKEAYEKRETHTLKVYGDVTYQTFFDEIFVSQFYFFTEYLPAYRGDIVKEEKGEPPFDTPMERTLRKMGGTWTTKTWKERPIMLSRGPAELRTYERI